MWQLVDYKQFACGGFSTLFFCSSQGQCVRKMFLLANRIESIVPLYKNRAVLLNKAFFAFSMILPLACSCPNPSTQVTHLYLANKILTLVCHCSVIFPNFLYAITYFHMLKAFCANFNILKQPRSTHTKTVIFCTWHNQKKILDILGSI